MGRIAISVYRAKPGMQEELEAIVGRHWPVLRAQQLVTERRPSAMRASDGSIVEVFEWASNAAIESAHHNPAVQAVWSEFDAACTFVPLSALPEAAKVFADFPPLAGVGD
jgi:hypothetical protein